MSLLPSFTNFALYQAHILKTGHCIWTLYSLHKTPVLKKNM